MDYTITITPAEASRLAAAVGERIGAVDAQVPPQPRSATAAEVRQFIVTRMKQLIIDSEGRKMTKSASDAVVVPAFNPTIV